MDALSLLLAAALAGDDPEALSLCEPELMIDRRLVESSDGLSFRMHPPRPAETALVLDRPWEGIVCGYFTVIHDPRYEPGPYRMWYRGRPTTSRRDGQEEAREVTCYADSLDGVHWTRPSLGQHEVEGTLDNNVVLVEPVGVTHNFSPFLDTRPGTPADQRYKAVGGISTTGLWAFDSPDGLHWRPARDGPVIREGALDSQNVVFYSPAEQAYVCFLRTWRDGIRSISRCTSPDFLQWSALEDLQFGDAPREHLYTNQIQPYFRAPGLLIGTAARFFPGRRGLTPEQADSIHLDDPRNYGGLDSGVSDAVLITGRDGVAFRRPFLESFVRPGPRRGNWVARANYPALGIVPTAAGEMSMYVQRCYGQQDHHVQRLVLRTDGFVSLSAPYAGGEWISRVFTFPGAVDRADPAVVDQSSLAVAVEGDAHDGPALRFRRAASFDIPGTAGLGQRFTLSARVSQVPDGHRRLFSAYDGGSTAPGELVFDFDSDTDLGDGCAIRFHHDGEELCVPTGDLAPWVLRQEAHTLSVTWDRGLVEILFDRRRLARKQFAATEVALRLGDLRFGEDYPPASQDNEPFLGLVDQILVAPILLSAEQWSRLHDQGVSAVPEARAVDGFLLPVSQQDSPLQLHDVWGVAQNAGLPAPPSMARQKLWINYSTSAAGGLRFEIQDERGVAIPGYKMAECEEVLGDEVAGFVRWKKGADVAELAGRRLRLRGWMKDADLFSLQFSE